MANSSAVSILDSNSSAKTVSTIDAMFSVAGTPSSVNVLTVQPSTAIFTVTVGSISSGTITSVSSATVFVSSGTIGVVASVSSATVNLSGGAVFTAVGAPSSLNVMTVQQSTAPWALASSQFGNLGATVMTGCLPVTMATNQTAFGIAQDTSILTNGSANATLTPAFAAISATSSGPTTIVSSQASKKIRVLQFIINANGTVNASFTNGTSSNPLSGPYYLNANTGAGGTYCPLGLFQTNSSEGLTINLSAASSVAGSLVYVMV